jgi:hypothetical protein
LIRLGASDYTSGRSPNGRELPRCDGGIFDANAVQASLSRPEGRDRMIKDGQNESKASPEDLRWAAAYEQPLAAGVGFG